MRRVGIVSLVGAGPGDPELLTLRAMRCLQRAEVVVYDRLIDPRILDHAPARAQRIFVGKAAGRASMSQRDIEAVLIKHALEGRDVVRLKGGDPFLFGRGGEEVEALTAAGIPYDVVPGVSSALAVPASAGIPVTHRRLASSVTVITGHEDPEKFESSIDWLRQRAPKRSDRSPRRLNQIARGSMPLGDTIPRVSTPRGTFL